MNLIDRYVNEVGRRLPRKKRDDVKLELRSLLEDTLDDRFGGQPSEEDVEAVLLEFGSPEKVAASYQPSGQYLVSPEMFPFFKIVLGAVVLAVSIGLAVAFAMGAIFAGPEEAGFGAIAAEFLASYVQALLAAVGSIVIVFFILQRLGVQPDLGDDSDWKPDKLPEVDDFDLVGRGESIAGVAFSAVFLVLLNVFADKIGIVVSWGDSPLLNDVVQDNLFLLNLVIALGLALNLVLLWRGKWDIFTRAAKLVTDILWLVVVIRLVGGLRDGKDVLSSAGMVDPLPNMFVLFGYFVIAAVAIGILVNTVKVVLNAIKHPHARVKINLGSE